ncbi:MAG TPA: hypothetical protein VI997_04085 [Candidatus Thermoplasmatota archaeon]|nr:hypothetical protein [Candidatus Thermoplasmatota archaeon]
MEPDARLAKKRREAAHLAALPPDATLEMGFSMIRFARRFAEAADRARV